MLNFLRMSRGELPNQLRTPSPSISGKTAPTNVDATPLISPSPPPPESIDPTSLHELISSVPAKTLREYTLSRLSSSTSSLDETVTQFFSALTPPPRLHCVRCHKFYYAVENGIGEGRCLIPHDDDSAEVERVGWRGGTEYETLWNCCGRTVEGDGDMGPPDGWCFEGEHTTDVKRARFRADSTIHDDKLTSCKRCVSFPSMSSPRSVSSVARPESVSSRGKKRNRTISVDLEQEDADGPKRSRVKTSQKRRPLKLGAEEEGVEEGVESMSIKPKPKPRKKRAQKTADNASFKPDPDDLKDTDSDDDMYIGQRRNLMSRKSAAHSKSIAFVELSTAKGSTRQRPGLGEIVQTSVEGEEGFSSK